MRRAACAGFVAMLSACAVLQEPASEPAREVSVPVKHPPLKPERVVLPPEPASAETLLGEFERLRRLSAADLAREQDAARQAFAQTRSDAARVQLAMALTAPGAPSSEAVELLEPLVKNPAAPLHSLAFLLSVQIQEQRRLIAQLQGLQQNNQGLQQNVQALQQNVQGLQQKLDALRTLERSLSERGEPAPRKR
jgi:DNA repair exonuclease SbcCD ATPase subunit